MGVPNTSPGNVSVPPRAWAVAAEYPRCVAHPHRLRMIEMLLRGRYTVGELAGACGIPSHMASEHLRLMGRCGLLASEREGRKRFYRVADPGLEGLLARIREWFDTEDAN